MYVACMNVCVDLHARACRYLMIAHMNKNKNKNKKFIVDPNTN